MGASPRGSQPVCAHVVWPSAPWRPAPRVFVLCGRSPGSRGSGVCADWGRGRGRGGLRRRGSRADGWGQSSPGGRTGKAPDPSEANWGLTAAGSSTREREGHGDPGVRVRGLAAPNPAEGRLGAPGEQVWGWGTTAGEAGLGNLSPQWSCVEGRGSQGRRRAGGGGGPVTAPHGDVHRGDV